jgi:hypothetical protein
MTSSTMPVAFMESLPINLERDVFLRNLIRELAGTLQDVVGLEEAAGFISVVGQRIGDQINNDYKTALQLEQLDRLQVARVLVDLKRVYRVRFTSSRRAMRKSSSAIRTVHLRRKSSVARQCA